MGRVKATSDVGLRADNGFKREGIRNPQGTGIGAGEGNRTLTSSLGSSRSATELLPLYD